MINLEKKALTLEERVKQFGARETAYALASKKILNICGMTLADLPDTSYLADLIDGMEDILLEETIDRDALLECMNEIDIDFIERIVMY